MCHCFVRARAVADARVSVCMSTREHSRGGGPHHGSPPVSLLQLQPISHCHTYIEFTGVQISCEEFGRTFYSMMLT